MMEKFSQHLTVDETFFTRSWEILAKTCQYVLIHRNELFSMNRSGLFSRLFIHHSVISFPASFVNISSMEPFLCCVLCAGQQTIVWRQRNKRKKRERRWTSKPLKVDTRNFSLSLASQSYHSKYNSKLPLWQIFFYCRPFEDKAHLGN